MARAFPYINKPMFSLVLFHSVFLNSIIGINIRHIADCLCSKCCAEREGEEKEKKFTHILFVYVFTKL